MVKCFVVARSTMKKISTCGRFLEIQKSTTLDIRHNLHKTKNGGRFLGRIKKILPKNLPQKNLPHHIRNDLSGRFFGRFFEAHVCLFSTKSSTIKLLAYVNL